MDRVTEALAEEHIMPVVNEKLFCYSYKSIATQASKLLQLNNLHCQ